ncbi:MAG: hypothetical protein H6737_12760 [Alphaproteobacteria bacterium]|nr:hypothetical protein [Alphaproteobacteria bacterium]
MTRLLPLFLLVGCSKGPLSGTWLYADSTIVSDSCQLLDDGDLLVGDFYLWNQGDGTMVIDPNDGSEIFTCTLEKGAFSCPDRLQDEQTQGQTTLSAVVAAEGAFDGREDAAGSQLGTVTCDGPGCQALEEAYGQSFPCTAEIEFTATWTSPTLPEEQ